jgi:predicted component of type VI protein secretion system
LRRAGCARLQCRLASRSASRYLRSSVRPQLNDLLNQFRRRVCRRHQGLSGREDHKVQQESLDPSDPKDRSEKQDSAVHLGNEDPADRSVERDQLAQLVHLAFLVPKATPAQRAPSDQQEQLVQLARKVQ